MTAVIVQLLGIDGELGYPDYRPAFASPNRAFPEKPLLARFAPCDRGMVATHYRAIAEDGAEEVGTISPPIKMFAGVEAWLHIRHPQ